MDWNLLKSFLAVGRAGSLSAASKAAGVSQPTLGRHINELEYKTGMALFSRGRSGMILTKPALELFEEALEIERHANRLSIMAQGKSKKLTGTVRLTASDVVSTYILPPILAQFGHLEPDIEIELIVSNEIQNLLSRDADIAIRMVQPTQLDIVAKKVNQMRMGAYADREYLEKYGTPRSMEDFFEHKLIGYDRSDLILKSMKALGIKGEREMFAFRTDDQVAYWELVKSGAGIGFGPNFIAAKSPNLIRLVEQMEIPKLDIWLASHQELRTSSRIRRVMDYLSQNLTALNLE